MGSQITSSAPLAMCPICEVRLPYLDRLTAHLQAEHRDCQVGYASLEEAPINRIIVNGGGRFFIKVNNKEQCWLAPFIDGVDSDASLCSSWHLMHNYTPIYFLVKVVN